MKAAQARTKVSVERILFATDFSQASGAAAQIAKQIARCYGAKIYAVHVNKFPDYTAAAPDAWQVMKDAEERESQEDAERLNQELRNNEHLAIREGRVWEVVSELIQEKGIDLVIVGTQGRTGLEKMLLGSVAEEILRQAPCPVLTVGPNVNLWSDEYAHMREILYATDLTAEVPVAGPFAVSLAQQNQAHLVLLHVIEDPKAEDLVKSPQVLEATERKLRELLPTEAGLWCEPTSVVEQGASAEKILDVAKRRHTDLIVLGARPAKGRAATHLAVGAAHHVISQAPCPVLTVRG